jgi:hypothetical protein
MGNLSPDIQGPFDAILLLGPKSQGSSFGLNHGGSEGSLRISVAAIFSNSAFLSVA